MKVEYTIHPIRQQVPHKEEIEFRNVPFGEVFSYDGQFRIKLHDPVTHLVVRGGEVQLEVANALRIGKNSGRLSTFSEGTVVSYYPDATLYIGG